MTDQQLKTDPNFTDADSFYAELTSAHRDLTPEESERVNVRLVLLLANHIGDTNILNEAISIAQNLDT
jgi:Protein of unknown function (DUF2783)